MAQKNNPVRTHYLVTENFLMTRAAALQFPAKQFSGMIADENTVYGVIIDIPVNPKELQTLVVYINGATNLYFNNGASYTGAAQRYPSLVQAGRLLTLNASSLVKEAERTKSYPMPTNQIHNVYLLTKRGTYVLSYLPTAMEEASPELKIFNSLFQRVKMELITAMRKDREAKKG
jgi:hypothetical protein